MIQPTQQSKKLKAVGLMSGGLDSTLAAHIMKEMGVDVHGVFFAMPWGCCDKEHAQAAADSIGIKFITLQLDERYLEVVRTPKHGRGFAMNPCVDCRVHMFTRAAKYMRHIGADFVFSGEILGQRPMSQKRIPMRLIEESAGLKGRLLRPLCAQLFEETQMEKDGLIDRSKLLDLVGRSRSPQYKLAQKFGVAGYSAPAGGCSLTDRRFSRRIEDIFTFGYRNFRETISLKWGRHFRLSKDFKCTLGRNHEENQGLLRYAHPEDVVMELPDCHGPTLILKGDSPSNEILQLCAGLVQRFSKLKSEDPTVVKYWAVKNRNEIRTIIAQNITNSQLKQFEI